jgi:Leucine-rich repeat (LRR) protein
MHVDGSGRGISSFDLGNVLGGAGEREALIAIKSLDISSNRIAQLADLEALSALTLLDGSHNQITLLRRLPLNLTKLVLAWNQLDSLAALRELPCLAELDVSHNNLQTLDGCPVTLVALRASSNRLTSFDEIRECIGMEHLDIAQNADINDVRRLLTLRELPNLKALLLNGCGVATTPHLLTRVLQLCPALIEFNGSQCVLVNHVDDSSAAPVPQPAAAVQPRRRSAYSDARKRVTDAENEVRDRSAVEAEASLRVDLDRVRAECHRLQVLLYQERTDNAELRKSARNVETKLLESKRVLSEELSQLALARNTIRQQQEENAVLREKSDRLARDLRHARDRGASAQHRAAATAERQFVEQEKELNQLRKTCESVSRALGKVSAERDMAVRDAAKLRQRVQLLEASDAAPIRPPPKDDGTDASSSGSDCNRSTNAAQHLARELHRWVSGEFTILDQSRTQSPSEARTRGSLGRS